MKRLLYNCILKTYITQERKWTHMNKQKLVGIMYEHGDKQKDLADALGLSLSRLNAKLNETEGAQFTQHEIYVIKVRYDLTPEQLEEIFFTALVS